MRFYEIRNYDLKSNLFEVDFNRKDLIQKVMNGPIQCGFEAETVWPNISSVDYDELSWSDVLEEISTRTRSSILESYSEWLMDNHTEYYYDTIVDELLEEEDNLDSMREFIDSQNLENELEQYQEENEDEDEEDFIASEYNTEYYEFLREKIAEEHDVNSMAFERAENDYSVEDWIDSEYRGSVSLMLIDFGESLSEHAGGLVEIAEIIENKFRREVKSGSYAEHGGSTTPDYWRVEEDSSIDAEGYTGAEIISPVYDSPAEMLKDIKSLFELFRENEVYTNRSTGFHVTMSLGTEQPKTSINRVKVATLLGDEYLLKQFDRLNNHFAASQMGRIQRFVAELARDSNPDMTKLDKLEKLILDAEVTTGKYSSVHFKSLMNEHGNELVEFRIAGGDYLSDINKISKALVKYGTVILAGYDDEMFNRDYLKALAKLIDRGVDPVTTRSSTKPKLPKTNLVNAVSEFLRVYKEELSANEVSGMLALLDEVYNIYENQAHSSSAIAFFTLLSKMARVMVNVPYVKPNSNIIIGIRKGFEELGVTRNDYIQWVSASNDAGIIKPALKQLLGPVADIPVYALNIRDGYRYVAPRSVVQSMYTSTMNPADVSKIVEIPEQVYVKLVELLSDRPVAVANGDTETVEKIDAYHKLVDDKFNVYVYIPGSTPGYKPEGLTDNHMYIPFALSELRDNGVVLRYNRA